VVTIYLPTARLTCRALRPRFLYGFNRRKMEDQRRQAAEKESRDPPHADRPISVT
jgi:hypothetical protein